MKTIGVLGGLGPQATMDFEARLHRAARRLITPSANAGYPPMVVWYCRHPPAVMAGPDVPALPFRAEPRLLDAARRLGAMADFLVIPSNGTHVFADDIARAAGRPVLNMVDLAVAEVRRREWRTVGVLTMGEPLVYTGRLAAAGVACRTIDRATQGELNRAILACMEGKPDDAGVVRSAVEHLRAQVVDGVILGCTELPILLGPGLDDADPTLLNPGALLAEAAVRHAME